MSTDRSPVEGMEGSDMLCDVGGESALLDIEYEAAAQRAADVGARRVLDWGAGFGHLSTRLAARGLEVNSFDYRSELGTEPTTVRFRQYPDLEITVSGDPVNLPYGDESFDAVVSHGTLEHVSDPIGSLAELRRILRPGGWLLVSKLPNRWSYVEYLARRTGRYYHGKLPHDHVYTVSSAALLIDVAGFEVLEAKRLNVIPLTHLGRRLDAGSAPKVWRINQLLSRTPGINLFATNVDVVARKP